MARKTDGPSVLNIPLIQGQNEGSGRDAPDNPPGTLYVAENMRIRGRSLEKRWGTIGIPGNVPSGYTAYGLIASDGSTREVPYPAFLTHQGEEGIIGVSSGDALSFPSASGVAYSLGRFSTCLPDGSRAKLQSTPTGPPVMPGSALDVDGVLCTASVEFNAQAGFNTLSIRVISKGGTLLWSRMHAADVRQAKVINPSRGVFIVAWHEGTDLYAQRITVTATGVVASISNDIGNLNPPTRTFDVASYDAMHFYVLNQSAAALVSARRFLVSSLTEADQVDIVTTGIVPLSLWADVVNQRVWVGIFDGSQAVRWEAYSEDLSTIQGTGIIATGANYGPPLFGPVSGYTKTAQPTGAFYAFRYANPSAELQSAVYVGRVNVNEPLPAAPVPYWHALPISKPDHKQRVWLWSEHGSPTLAPFSRAFLAQFPGDLVEGVPPPPVISLSGRNTLAVPSGFGPRGNRSYFHAVGHDSATGASRASFVIPSIDRYDRDVPVMRYDQIDYTTAPGTTHLETIQRDNEIAVPGQPTVLGVYRGGLFFGTGTNDTSRSAAWEWGYATTPVITSATTQSTPTGMATGVYSYRYAFESFDRFGKRHLSPPCAPVTATLTTVGSVQVKATSLSLSQRSDYLTGNVNAVLYRTVQGGTTYHRNRAAQAIVTTDGILTFVDNSDDCEIEDEEILYTDGGVLQHDLAPACKFMAVAEDRVWCGGLLENYIIQASKVIIPGEPAEFSDHPSHQVVLPRPCTGIAYQDGQVIAFCEESIYLISGEGPNDQGVGVFPPPRLFEPGLGCIDYRSIRATAIGVIFQSRRGLELIPRGNGPVQYFGAPVQDQFQLEGRTQCLASAVMPTRDYHLARFLMTSSTGTSGRDIVTYDIRNQQWFHDTLPTGAPVRELGAWPRGFATCQENLDSDDVSFPIWYENAAVEGDQDGIAVPTGSRYYIQQRLKTTTVFPFGPAGHGKINKALVAMRPRGTNQQVTVTARVDDYPEQSASWTVPPSGAIEYRMMDLVNRHGTSVEIEAKDSATGTYGPSRGVTFLALGLEIDPDNGVRLLKSSERS